MIRYQSDTLYGVVDQLDELIRLHFNEVNIDLEEVPLSPDWKSYAALEHAGLLRIFSAREEGTLVGYCAFFVNYHLHHNKSLVAVNDCLFLHPDYRKGTCGIKLIKFCEDQLKKLGVDKITWHITVKKDFRPILHRLGYVDEEVVVTKILKEKSCH